MLEDARHIHDGPEYFPDSCVVYVRFANRELRQAFAYLREREQILQRENSRSTIAAELALIRSRLDEIQAVLIFFAHNFDEARAVAKIPKRRKPGRVSDSQMRLL